MRRWLLLCVLALAVIGMHHVASGTSGPCPPETVISAATTPQAYSAYEPTTCSGHDLLHLCLAVLGTAAGVLLAWLLVAVGAAPAPRPRALAARSRRARRTAGRSLLTSVCVLRI
jgi:hypothetical protein